jgi:hypothetical protein
MAAGEPGERRVTAPLGAGPLRKAVGRSPVGMNAGSSASQRVTHLSLPHSVENTKPSRWRARPRVYLGSVPWASMRLARRGLPRARPCHLQRLARSGAALFVTVRAVPPPRDGQHPGPQLARHLEHQDLDSPVLQAGGVQSAPWDARPTCGPTTTSQYGRGAAIAQVAPRPLLADQISPAFERAGRRDCLHRLGVLGL